MTREIKKWKYEIISFIINQNKNKDRNCCTALVPVSRSFQADLQLSVLVSAGTELTLFLVAGIALSFGFSVRMILITL